MKQVDLTINILSYNRKNYLVECLKSVLNQTVAPKLIVINDNGSEKEVYGAVRPYITDTVVWRGSEITYDSLWNFSRSVNNLTTKYVMVLHDDDRLLPNFLQIQAAIIEKYPEVLAFSANGVTIDRNGERLGDLVINDLKELFYFKDAVSVVNHSLISCIPMSPIIYESKIFETIALNPKFGKCSDTGLYLDIIKQGPIVINNVPIYECRVHDSQDSTFFPLNDFKAIFELFEVIALNQIINSNISERVYEKYTNIVLSRIYNAVTRKNGGYDLVKEVKLISNHKFKFQYVYDFFKNRLNRK